MEQRRTVNVWFDRPADFLDIGWNSKWAVDGHQFPNTQYWFEVDLAADLQAVGLKLFGATRFARQCDAEAVLRAEVEPHPVTVKYDRPSDLWDIRWGPGIVECVDTPNPRIRAKVDAEGQIQGVLISDLRTFEDEILNQDLYPVKPGAATA